MRVRVCACLLFKPFKENGACKGVCALFLAVEKVIEVDVRRQLSHSLGQSTPQGSVYFWAAIYNPPAFCYGT